ncbi:tyrosine-type recombinase/integrase [Ktedonobacter robiniae]|uniref:Site-specific integrase n=1 Tax=Ktedonobacter robiniae TaxID=2778365 RepID=A0ABQ3UJP1_9CHLR|nr:tyrosine-type recombinase/integrase [Ktedonobacter robiniae]GHO52906.1 site-specific integrase [Ktedonobacter robiniae]
MAGNKRRGHHEGSVYYVESRERWVAEVTIATGKRKKFYFKTKQEALKKKNEALRELEMGVLATGTRRRLGDYLEDWLENVHKGRLRVGTYVNYKKLIKYVIADLGDIWLQKLTPQHVQTFYSKKLDEGLSSKLINNIHGVLHVALENAVRWGLAPKNVCDLVTPPRIVSREVVPLSVEQARWFVDRVKKNRLEVLLVTAVVTGMRRGELLALRWADIDFARRRLLVLHSVDFIAGHGYVEGQPKTVAGRRVISLPSFLVDMLKQHRALQQDARKSIKGWQDRDLVFPNLKGGYLHPAHMGEKFRKILVEAGLPPIHFHDLRHSAASILLCMGVNIKVIQELLGHSDISITLRTYSHLLPSMQQEIVETWNEVFKEDKKEKEEPR